MEEQKVQRIIDDPDNVALRLNFAKEIEQHSPHRAEFIRIQTELSKLPETDKKVPALRRREAEFLVQFGALWAGAPMIDIDPNEEEPPNPEFGPRLARWDKWRFDRGLLGYAAMTAREFLDHCESIFQTTPIRRLFLHGILDPSVSRFSENPTLLRMYQDLYGESDTVKPLASCDSLLRLNHLELNFHMLGDDTAAPILNSPNLASLRSLELFLGFDCNRAAENAALSPHLSSLRTLELRYNDDISYSGYCGDTGAIAIAESNSLSSLQTLVLERGHIGPAGLAAIASSPHLPNLRALNIGGNSAGGEGLQALCDSQLAHRIYSLGLSGDAGADNVECALGSEGIEFLANCLSFDQLKELDLSVNEIDSHGVIRLTSSKTIQNLEALNLSCNRIGDDGVSALAKSSFMSNVRRLQLDFNEITDQGIEELTKSSKLAR